MGRSVGECPKTGSSLFCCFPHPKPSQCRAVEGDCGDWQQLCPQETLSQPHWVLAEVVSIYLRVAVVFWYNSATREQGSQDT